MLTMKPVEATPTDERAVRCAEHNTTFYASFPRHWEPAGMLRALAAHFRAKGHHHPPFETIDLTPPSLILPRLATAEVRQRAA